MNPDLTKLPPPPQGQTGITLDQFKHLPPPPKGQQGFTLDQIKNQQTSQKQTTPPMPLASKTSASYNQNFLTSLKDVGTGFLKGAASGARDVASGLQTMGQRLIAGFSPGGVDQNLEKIKATTGFKSLDNSTPEGAGVANTLESKNRGEQVGNLLETGTELALPFSQSRAEKLITKGKQAYEGLMATKEAKSTEGVYNKIAETISPNPTAKESQLAQRQGRLVEGREPTFFKSGTPDKILPSKNTLDATNTIIRNIPNAKSLKPSELFTAVEDRIGKTAKVLRPEMEKTAIKPQTIEKINTDWEAAKKAQMEIAPASEELNVAKRQAKFEALLKKSGSSSHADLWDTRIAYDNSIPDAVKKATTESSESLQLQKDEWLQNRAILNKAINDNTLGMGQKSQRAFKDMTDLYEARTNLQSKAKVKRTVQASKLYTALTGRTAKTIEALGLVGGGAYGIKKAAEAASNTTQ